MPRRIKTGSSPSPCHHEEYNNDFEFVKAWDSPDSGDITIDIDIPSSTVDEAHILIAMMSAATSGPSSGGTGDTAIASTSSNEPAATKVCYSCYDDLWDADDGVGNHGVGVLDVASGSPGINAADVAMSADLSYRLVTQDMPAGTVVSISPDAGGGECQFALAYFKGGRTVRGSGGGLSSPSTGDDVPNPFTFDWNLAKDITIPGGGGLVIIAGLMDGSGGASECGLTHHGFYADGGWLGYGNGTPMVYHSFPRLGSYVTTSYPLVPPCNGSEMTYHNAVVWSYAIVPGTGVPQTWDAQLAAVAPHNPLAKAGWVVFEGAERGPQGCADKLRVAQHHHAPQDG